jgi:hypothetical protein
MREIRAGRSFCGANAPSLGPTKNRLQMGYELTLLQQLCGGIERHSPHLQPAMWNISSNDVEQAKESIRLRRAATEARYEDETRALDAEFAAVETLERAASEFALSQLDQMQAAPDDPAPAEAEISDGSEEKIPSRWRLHLGSRPSDADGAIGNIQSTR